MNTEHILWEATRQFRHNDDNSPSLTNPAKGFVIAYDREIIERALREAEREITLLKDTIETLQEQEDERLVSGE